MQSPPLHSSSTVHTPPSGLCGAQPSAPQNSPSGHPHSEQNVPGAFSHAVVAPSTQTRTVPISTSRGSRGVGAPEHVGRHARLPSRKTAEHVRPSPQLAPAASQGAAHPSEQRSSQSVFVMHESSAHPARNRTIAPTSNLASGLVAMMGECQPRAQNTRAFRAYTIWVRTDNGAAALHRERHASTLECGEHEVGRGIAGVRACLVDAWLRVERDDHRRGCWRAGC